MEALADRKSSPDAGGAAKTKRAAPSSTYKALITQNLRLAYSEVAREPLPQRFLDLLQQGGDAEEMTS